MKILIVDDSRKHRNAAKSQLEALGHEVVIMGCYADVFRGHVSKENFDIALIDLLMPAETMTLGEKGMEHFGQEIMVGYPLSIFLAKSSIPHIAVVTDTNHHDHPACAIMDFFLDKPLDVNGGRICFMHASLMADGSKDWAAALWEILQPSFR